MSAPVNISVAVNDLKAGDRVVNIGTVLPGGGRYGVWYSLQLSVQRPDLSTGRYVTVTDTHLWHEGATVLIEVTA